MGTELNPSSRLGRKDAPKAKAGTMRYYFSLLDEMGQDEICLDLPEMAAVRREANHHARDILAEHVLERSHCEKFFMIVTDQSGARVWSLNFSAFDGSSPGGEATPIAPQLR